MPQVPFAIRIDPEFARLAKQLAHPARLTPSTRRQLTREMSDAAMRLERCLFSPAHARVLGPQIIRAITLPSVVWWPPYENWLRRGAPLAERAPLCAGTWQRLDLQNHTRWNEEHVRHSFTSYDIALDRDLSSLIFISSRCRCAGNPV